MDKRKANECARQNKTEKPFFISSPLLKILLIQMLSFKIQDDHLPNGAKGNNLSGKLGSNALDIQASVSIFHVEIQRTLRQCKRKNFLKNHQFGVIQSGIQLFKNIY